MAYTWKTPLFKVDAQTAGEELDRIYSETGKIEPKEVVNRSRAENAPLHPCFDWNDATAAEKYRESQAATIIRNIVVVSETHEEPKNVRAFVSVQQTYQPMRVVVQDPVKMDELLSCALRELKCFEAKYKALEELQPVFDVIEKVTA